MTTQVHPRTWIWRDVEKRYGAAMRDILLAAHAQYGGFPEMSRGLGINAATLRDWWMRCRLAEFGKQDDGSVTVMVCGEVT